MTLEKLVKEIERISGKTISTHREFQDVIKEYKIYERLSILWLLKHPTKYSEWKNLREIAYSAHEQLKWIGTLR